jgi:hypothetical protein
MNKILSFATFILALGIPAPGDQPQAAVRLSTRYDAHWQRLRTAPENFLPTSRYRWAEIQALRAFERRP